MTSALDLRHSRRATKTYLKTLTTSLPSGVTYEADIRKAGRLGTVSLNIVGLSRASLPRDSSSTALVTFDAGGGRLQYWALLDLDRRRILTSWELARLSHRWGSFADYETNSFVEYQTRALEWHKEQNANLAIWPHFASNDELVAVLDTLNDHVRPILWALTKR